MIYDILVIGGGPAGLTAAIYGSRGGARVLVLERAVCGGQIINSPAVENYPGRPKVSGVDLMMDMMDQALSFGTEIIYDEVTAVAKKDDLFTVSGQSAVYTAKTIIIATGRKNRPLDVSREEELIGKGISYCATCDGGFYRGKDTAVIGGGNTALHDAIHCLEQWTAKWQMYVNTAKCAVLYCGPHNPRLDYNLSGQTLAKVDTVRDLGVLICHDLSFRAHISDVVKRATKAVNFIFIAIKSRSPTVLTRAYTVYARPILEFTHFLHQGVWRQNHTVADDAGHVFTQDT